MMPSSKEESKSRKPQESPGPKSIHSKFKIVATIFAIIAVITALTFRSYEIGHSHDSSRICSELGPRLSHSASIILPHSADFAAATIRWTEYQAPTFSAVVEVASERDVQETVSAPPSFTVHFMLT